jgi:hypothetical protein
MASTSSSDTIFAALAMPLLAFLTICGIYLIHRARLAKLPHVFYLGVSFLSLAIFYVAIILRGLDIWVPFAFSTSIGQLGIIALNLFVIKAFYPERPGVRKLMLVVVAVLAVITATTATVRDLPGIDPGMGVTLRMLHTVFATLQLAIASAFQASSSLIDYRKYRNEPVDRFVLFRYLAYGIAGLTVFASAWLDLLGTVFSILGMAEYEITQIIQISFVFTFSILNLVVWVMPRWVKNLINKSKQSKMADNEIQVDEEEVMRTLAHASGSEEQSRVA